MKKIKLTKGKFAIVDDEDFEWLNQWKWHYANVGYAARNFFETGKTHKTRKHKTIFMHRIINETPDTMVTDHINRNKLDNRKINLRTCTQSQNLINASIRSDNITGIRGVYWNKQKKKWQSKIVIFKKQIHLGFYSNINDASLARMDGEKKYAI